MIVFAVKWQVLAISLECTRYENKIRHTSLNTIVPPFIGFHALIFEAISITEIKLRLQWQT